MVMMLFVSLLLNVVVLIPICAGLLRDAPWAVAVYGVRSPARGILLSVYLSILIVSAGLMLAEIIQPAALTKAMSLALFVMQIVYKMTTPMTVGTLRNPVVVSNLLIAGVHLVTSVLLWGSLVSIT